MNILLFLKLSHVDVIRPSLSLRRAFVSWHKMRENALIEHSLLYISHLRK